MRRYIRSLLTNSLAVVVGATLIVGSQTTTDPAPQTRTETIQLVPCSSGRVADGQDGSVVQQVELQCYRGRGPWGSGLTALPGRGAPWASSYDFGNIHDGPRADAKPMSKIERLARRKNVPWPKNTSNTDLHGVYVIYTIRSGGGVGRIYKYGITKNGASRPRRQLSKCENEMKVRRCGFRFLRTGIKGWTRARQVEAGYAVKYKVRFKTSKCPPGMPKCR